MLAKKVPQIFCSTKPQLSSPFYGIMGQTFFFDVLKIFVSLKSGCLYNWNLPKIYMNIRTYVNEILANF